MPQTFKCPACGSQLDAPEDGAVSMRCGLCSAIIPVPEHLRAVPPEMVQLMAQIQAGNKIEAIKLYRQLYGVGLFEAKNAVEALEKGTPLPAAAPNLPADADLAEIETLARAGQTIAAIKLYRQYYGKDLAEAKAAVEAMQRGLPVPAAAAPVSPSSPEMAEILVLVRANQKLEAIKLYRQRYAVGLKEAKDAVDALERGQPLPPAPAPYQPITDASGKRAGGCAAVLLVCLALLAASLAAF